MSKHNQTIYERAEVGEKVVFRLREILKDQPLEVLGHMDTAALCCSGGTVAIVKVNLDEVVRPKQAI